jgi:hypothetical protein
LNGIPFDAIKSASLAHAPHLLSEWFPQGRIIGREFKVGSINGEVGQSLAVNLTTGLWADFADPAIRGADMIDLRAAVAHQGDLGAAARELAQSLGININGYSGDVPRHKVQTKPTKAPNDWLPMVPPPAGVAPPDEAKFRGFGTVYEYTNLDDRVTHYIGRIEARPGRKKIFIPITYGVLDGVVGWHEKRPENPLPLYSLNKLIGHPNAPVMLCEGEKSADAAQSMFLEYVCLSWCGGTGSVDYADVTPIQGRNIIIWPDADDGGIEAAKKIAARLPGSRTVRVDGLPDKFDAADLHVDDPDAWLNERLDQPSPKVELADALSALTWAALDVPIETRLLGDFITSTTRAFLVGSTGLGKTLVAYAMAGGMATGRGFLHWTCDRPSRWLIIDGEMPTALVKSRAADMIRRAGGNAIPPRNIMIYSRDRAEEFARIFPSLGQLAPLNTEAGHHFVMDLIEAVGGVDGVIFDNVMSLAPGDQKDEEIWAGCIPLVEQLTRAGIAQVWCDHTGHNTARQYGSNTKSWRFDAVGIMTPLIETERPTDHVAFQLSFDSPGKARRRTPDSWTDFQPHIIRLIDDEWISEPASAPQIQGNEKRLSDKPAVMLTEIRAAVARFGREQKIDDGGEKVVAVPRSAVRDHLIRAGWFADHLLCDALQAKALTRPGFTAEQNGLISLKRKGLIDFNKNFIWIK